MRALGLLAPCASPPLDLVLAHLYRDKKVRDGKVRWALPAGQIGTCVVRDDVPEDLVRELLTESLEGALVTAPRYLVLGG